MADQHLLEWLTGADTPSPRWLRDLLLFHEVRSQFILSGNVRDVFPLPDGDRYDLPTITSYLGRVLRAVGYRHVLAYDVIDGFSVVGAPPTNSFLRNTLGLEPPAEKTERIPGDVEVCTVIERLVTDVPANSELEKADSIVENPTCILIDFGSRAAVRADQLTDPEHKLFRRAFKLAHTSRPVPLGTSPVRYAHNLVIWLCDERENIPAWYLEDSPRIRHIPVGAPTSLERRAISKQMVMAIPGARELKPEVLSRAVSDFAQHSEGLTFNDMGSIQLLASSTGMPVDGIVGAIRNYQVGVTEDGWLRVDDGSIRAGRNYLEDRVIGQSRAVTKALDIIKRAKMGLAAAHAQSSARRPRGVLFFGGPTGVGKTELAKAITSLLFSTEENYIRFDMSEFSQEHDAARLLGAPPGYVGYDAGGELVNAIRQRPFAVILFDEVEKAHPRILDKFLQLLDEGQITSGRGERVFFNQALVIFTSNLGIYEEVPEGGRIVRKLKVDLKDPGNTPELVDKLVRAGIIDHFTTKIGRPELLNRIGDNIIVFDFIRPGVDKLILDKMFGLVVKRLADDHNITLSISDVARASLQKGCFADLAMGGRGIGNKVESMLVNPLARELFDQQVSDGSMVVVDSLFERDGIPECSIRFSGQATK